MHTPQSLSPGSLRIGMYLLLASLPAAGALGQAKPPGSIDAIDRSVAPFVQDKVIAGAVTLVAVPEGVLHKSAIGLADIDQARPMITDAIFWIASMSKPITATSVLMLQDEGKLSVDDPVSRYIPEFGRLKDAGGNPVVVTIRHLLTHTSGLAEVARDQAATITTLEGLVEPITSQPIRFEPGSKWAYCQSGINMAARVVEVASGLSFPEFLDTRLFQPLGMPDTTFYLSEGQLARLATSYSRTAEGTLIPAEISILYGKSPTSRDRYPAANGGLFSTAADYARFCQMIQSGGEFEGRRYVSPESVKLMTSLQTGDLQTGFTPGNGWGLGWCVVREPQGVTAALSPGSFGHGGAYGTQAWIDPVKRRIDILMVQRANFPNSDQSEVRQAFEKAASAALDEAP